MLARAGDPVRRSEGGGPDRAAAGRAPDEGRLLGVELSEHGAEHGMVDGALVADAEQLGPLLPDHRGAQPGLGLARGLVVSGTQGAEALPAAVDPGAGLLADGGDRSGVGLGVRLDEPQARPGRRPEDGGLDQGVLARVGTADVEGPGQQGQGRALQQQRAHRDDERDDDELAPAAGSPAEG